MQIGPEKKRNRKQGKKMRKKKKREGGKRVLKENWISVRKVLNKMKKNEKLFFFFLEND